MRRRLFYITAAISLLLCVMVVGLWLYSQFRFTRITLIHGLAPPEPKDRRVVLLAWRDAAELVVQTETLRPGDNLTADQLRQGVAQMRDVIVYQQSALSIYDPGEEPDAAEHWGFHYRSPAAARAMFLAYSTEHFLGTGSYLASVQSEHAFFVPWWFLFALLAILPGFVLARWMRSRRRRHLGRCLNCSYDLTGNTSGVCPECGMPIRSATAAVRA